MNPPLQSIVLVIALVTLIGNSAFADEKRPVVVEIRFADLRNDFLERIGVDRSPDRNRWIVMTDIEAYFLFSASNKPKNDKRQYSLPGKPTPVRNWLVATGGNNGVIPALELGTKTTWIVPQNPGNAFRLAAERLPGQRGIQIRVFQSDKTGFADLPTRGVCFVPISERDGFITYAIIAVLPEQND